MTSKGERLTRTLGLLGVGIGLTQLLAPRAVARAIGLRRERGIRVRKAITVDNSPEEAYNFWRNFENLPRFMTHLESVRVMDQRRSYWKAKAPLGATIEWVAEITEDRPNQLIAWRSLESADAPNAGQVRFVAAPGHRGTEVHVELTHAAPGGIIGATIAKLFGEEPSRRVDGALRGFKEALQSP